MRNRQPWLVDRHALHEQQIEVDRPWPVPRPVARPAELALDVEQHDEELFRSERGLDRDRGVEEPRLVEVADGIGLAEQRDGDDVDPLLLAEQLYRARERGAPVAEVRSEPHVGTTHNPSLNTPYIQLPARSVQLK